MARKPVVDESKLTKMEIRKLNALRRSVGDDIGTEAFLEWYAKRSGGGAVQATDKTAEAIADAVMQLIEGGKIKSLPRGGYVVRRGRGRVIVHANE